MNRNEILSRLNGIFREVFDDESILITDKSTADDIEAWDSLTHITLISEVEDAFGIKFKMKDIVGMKNVGEMADIILTAL